MFQAIHRVLRSLEVPLSCLLQHPVLPRHQAGTRKVLKEVHHLEQVTEDLGSMKEKYSFTTWSLIFLNLLPLIGALYVSTPGI